MEDLELLIKAIAGLPHMAIWALVVFYGYKVAVVGSIYGVIRFTVSKAVEAYKHKHLAAKQVQIEVLLDGVVFSTHKDAVLAQLRRVAVAAEGTKLQGGVDMIWSGGTRWLTDAINDKIEKDAKK